MSVCLSVHWFVTELFLRLFVASLKVFSNGLVCSSVCLPDFFESADAPDLGLMTLLNSEQFSHYCSCQTVRDWIAVYPALFLSVCLSTIFYFSLAATSRSCVLSLLLSLFSVFTLNFSQNCFKDKWKVFSTKGRCRHRQNFNTGYVIYRV